jgi:hypothetical protein
MKSVTRRIVDRRVLHLIKMWLECPVEETDDQGRKKRTTEAKDQRRGGTCVTVESPVRYRLEREGITICDQEGRHSVGLENDGGAP